MIADIFGILFLFSIGSLLFQKPKENFKPIFNIQEGKTRSLHSKGDISLYTQEIRRKVIKINGLENPLKLRETKTQLGSTTGVLETYMYNK